MIFATVGTNEAPFDRLVEALAAARLDEELIVQRGASNVAVPGAIVHEFVSFEEMIELMRRARLVVTHAGVGSILVALSVGKRPIVVPRSSEHGEAVDEHQSELAGRLAADGLVTIAEPEALADAIAAAADTSIGARSTHASALVEELRSAIDEAVARATPRSRRNG